jgi:hypothetical protein
MLKAWIAAVVLGLTLGPAWAKLPPPSEEAKAKLEETKAKAAETAKKDAEALGKSQDQVAERYIKLMKEKGVEVKPTPIAAPVPAPATPAAPVRQAAAPAAAKK